MAELDLSHVEAVCTGVHGCMDGEPTCPFLVVSHDLHYMQRFPFDVRKVCAMNVSHAVICT